MAAMRGKPAVGIATALLFIGSLGGPSAHGQDPRGNDLLVVDCKLPGQVRRLGQRTVYLSARRAARLTARDCQIRGGEYVEYDRADWSSALGAWLPAAQAGDQEAQIIVGEIYERGLGTAPDYVKAAQWYQLAADAGNPRAQVNLGHLYERGLGVPADPR
ncbi:MAG TPA: tetratricopeptide repeat protein, partial [Steroidobacteraceae bacterium]